jgi:hypothetical protein
MRIVLAVAALGCTPVTAPPVANVASFAPEGQRLVALVVDELASCVPHRIEISIDARRTSNVTITCPLPPPRTTRTVVVVSDGVPRMFDGAAVAIAPGSHTIVVRDRLTGRIGQTTVRFPVTRADTIVIGDYDDSIVVGVARRALLIFL